MKTSSGITYDDHGRGDDALLCLPGWCIRRDMFAPLAERLGLSHFPALELPDVTAQAIEAFL